MRGSTCGPMDEVRHTVQADARHGRHCAKTCLNVRFHGQIMVWNASHK